jgi:hypothetical protein
MKNPKLNFKIKEDSKTVWIDNSTFDSESKISAIKVFQIKKHSIVSKVEAIGNASLTTLTFELKTGEVQEVQLFEN